MRPVAHGRRNWLHIGSPQAGPEVAAILSKAAVGCKSGCAITVPRFCTGLLNLEPRRY
jgi:hypothetical protein